MRLGYAVKTLGGGGLPSHDARRWQSEPHLRVSIEYLRAVFAHLAEMEIGMYRFSPALAPYATHPDMPQLRRQVHDCAAGLAELGRMAAGQGLRLSCHPSQYIVLNSAEERVRRAAAADLELQGELFEAMALGPEAVVVIHVGGAPDGLRAGMERFMSGWELLSERARARVVLENDDRTYGLADVLAISARSGVRVVWDILHHHCHDAAGIPDREALELALATWPDGVRPKIHFSSPLTQVQQASRRVGRRVQRRTVMPQVRVHADLVDPVSFELFLRHTAAGLDFDVMLEAKAKDLAVLRLREQLRARGLEIDRPPAQGDAGAGTQPAGKAPAGISPV